MSLDLTAKRLELFKEATEGGTIAFLVNPANEQFAGLAIEETTAAAASLGLPLKVIETRTSGQLEGIFAEMAAEGIKSLVLASDAMFFGERTRIADLALRYGGSATISLRPPDRYQSVCALDGIFEKPRGWNSASVASARFITLARLSHASAAVMSRRRCF
jgi:hypothetical protein